MDRLGFGPALVRPQLEALSVSVRDEASDDLSLSRCLDLSALQDLNVDYEIYTFDDQLVRFLTAVSPSLSKLWIKGVDSGDYGPLVSLLGSRFKSLKAPSILPEVKDFHSAECNLLAIFPSLANLELLEDDLKSALSVSHANIETLTLRKVDRFPNFAHSISCRKVQTIRDIVQQLPRRYPKLRRIGISRKTFAIEKEDLERSGG